MAVQKFIRREDPIEAIFWNGDNAEEMRAWGDGQIFHDILHNKLIVLSDDHTFVVSPKTWVTRNQFGSIRDLMPGTFFTTYHFFEEVPYEIPVEVVSVEVAPA